MAKTTMPTLQGDVPTLQPQSGGRSEGGRGARTFVLEVADDASSDPLLASLPLLDRLLSEQVARVREHRMKEMVDFMAARKLASSAVDLEMAQRLARRHARILSEFGYYSAEQLGQANGSQASNRTALADNWRERRQMFAVRHPDKAAREPDIYPAFQFVDGKPVEAVQQVLEAFGGRKSPWKLALWFTSNNGALTGSARPVDLLARDPQAAVLAARRDAQENGV